MVNRRKSICSVQIMTIIISKWQEKANKSKLSCSKRTERVRVIKNQKILLHFFDCSALKADIYSVLSPEIWIFLSAGVSWRNLEQHLLRWDHPNNSKHQMTSGCVGLTFSKRLVALVIVLWQQQKQILNERQSLWDKFEKLEGIELWSSQNGSSIFTRELFQ